MDLQLKELSEWRQVATVEVPDRIVDLPQLVRDETLRFRIEPAVRAPTGYVWYDVFVEASTGERRAARTAWAVLTALRRSASEGVLEGLRIISGEHWLTIGDNRAESLDDDVPGCLRG